MEKADEFRLSEYIDLGELADEKDIRLMRHSRLGTICVKKHVDAELEAIYRFLKENPSPYIPTIYECIKDDDCMVILEQYIQGMTLEDVIEEQPMSQENAVEVIMQICSALKILHHAEPPIICRDLKAENIMLDTDGRVKLVDFDIARMVQDGKRRDTRLLGTPEYAAPEQYGFFQTDQRTDIYSLGVLINYMISGKFPVEYIISGPLEKIVRTCTDMDPKQRYQSVEQLEETLTEIAGLNKKENNQKSWKEWLPPGFRTKNVSHMLTAVLIYCVWIYFSFSMGIESEGKMLSGWRLRFEQSLICLAGLSWIAIICNYRGLRQRCFLVGSENIFIRCLGGIIWFLICILVAACICATIETFI